MNIELYSIPGISKTDTPVFANLAAQAQFFYNQTKKSISTGFYPPYFHNTIKLEIEDTGFNSFKWNYCRLDYDGDTASTSVSYYYFITKKKYINEYIIEIDIEMDTIQTFMFSVTWVNALLDRVSIRRWNTNTQIYRDYIRENISSNLFSKIRDYYPRNNTDDAMRNYTYIAKCSKDPDATTGNPFTGFYLKDATYANTYHNCQYMFMFSLYYNSIISGTTDNISPSLLTSDLGTNDYVVDIYLIPFRVIDPYSVTAGVISTLTSGWSSRTVGSSTSKLLWKQGAVITTYVTTGSITLPFDDLSNAYLGMPFSARHIPQLIDCNYIKLTFGDKNTRTEYPLYTLTDLTSLYYSYWADINTGYRYYNLYENISNVPTSFYDDHYNTIVCNPNVLRLDLKNDPWKEYLARNSATLAGAIMSSSLKAGTSTRSAEPEDMIEQGTGLKSIAAGADVGIKYAVNKINREHSPYSLRSAGSFTGNFDCKEIIVSSQLSLCDDFQDCAQYFEAYGYKVATHMDTSLFAINNRYLFDFVKTKELNVLIADLECRNNFIERFNNGLRLWHTKSYGDLNCKTSPYSCEMGDVYKYDNIEQWKYDALTAQETNNG